MIQLKGSEKQIAWAAQIIEKFELALDKRINLQIKIYTKDKPSSEKMDTRVAARIKADREHYQALLLKDAAWWITYRSADAETLIECGWTWQ